MSSPLTTDQKRILSQLARRALASVRHAAEKRGETFTVTEDDWRREQVELACGKHGLRCCSQDDYSTVKAHLLARLGRAAEAFEAHVRAATEKRRQAEAVLIRECEKADLRLSYADRICRDKFHCTVLDATEKQLWQMVFTIRNRARARRRTAQAKAASAVRPPSSALRPPSSATSPVPSLN
jgi:hypothetical protein